MKAERLFYIQNNYVGNAICWWREDGRGYTTNIKEAGKYPELEAKRQASIRPGEDIAWPCEYIDNNEKAHKTIIDGQYLNFKQAYIRKRRPYLTHKTNLTEER